MLQIRALTGNYRRRPWMMVDRTLLEGVRSGIVLTSFRRSCREDPGCCERRTSLIVRGTAVGLWTAWNICIRYRMRRAFRAHSIARSSGDPAEGACGSSAY